MIMIRNTSMASYPTRDVDRLYCPAITYRCAIGTLLRLPPRAASASASAAAFVPPPPCVACAYKICNFDVARDAAFAYIVPNARPETCPRSSPPPPPPPPSSSSSSNSSSGGGGDDDASSAGYRRGMRVLAVGDGDFSFSSAIADVVVAPGDDDFDDDDDDDGGGGGGLVVATSYESADTLRSVYPDFDATVRRLLRGGGGGGGRVVVVGYNVDATRLAETLPPPREASSRCSKGYHRICWNFPCTAIPSGQDGQNDAMERNRELVRQFVMCALPLLDEKCGEVHMAHKTKPPYNQWSLEKVALEGLMSVEEEEEEEEEGVCA